MYSMAMKSSLSVENQPDDCTKQWANWVLVSPMVSWRLDTQPTLALENLAIVVSSRW